ncbi:MAG: septum site-determining protein MinC [Flavobacteriaceae bacterium]
MIEHEPSFQLKGSLFTLTVLKLFHNDLNCFKKELAEKVEMAPNFFNHTPIVIDLHELAEEQTEIDFKSLKKIICNFHMIPVGIKGSITAQKEAIDKAGLAILAEAKAAVKKSEQTTEKTTVQKQAEENTSNKNDSQSIAVKEKINIVKTPQKTLFVKQTVRSGQQINAPDGDLIIIGSVSAGAEILAAGNIHIYGTLRGRALAGIKGDHNAGIFCHNLQAELISIAGIYLLCDDIPNDNVGASSHICLNQEKLEFQSL